MDEPRDRCVAHYTGEAALHQAIALERRAMPGRGRTLEESWADKERNDAHADAADWAVRLLVRAGLAEERDPTPSVDPYPRDLWWCIKSKT